ncbi:hypothetical protein [Thermomonospora cellulosilytica]|uniref:Uncharacterized protein n=1 Tax=Thermomonospora cellulosilytica TaxID=1411118 RepID=A0A7W3N1S3_9ACTN|nr:hypothetical protein [Thermomonospora cellulosilytica]MBA9005978.1 hypothetical protein [Thermomonospora cellulosilytica]
MDDSFEEKFERLKVELAATYTLLARLLSRLPIPIGIPPLEEEWDPEEAIEVLARTRTSLLGPQPIEDWPRGLIDEAVLMWLTAYEVGNTMVIGAPDPWKYDAVSRVLMRVISLADAAARELGFELDSE